MSPPSQLAIATSSVQRLVKEEASYHKELAKQKARLQNLEENPGDDENAEYQLKQEKLAIAETEAVFPPLRQRIKDSVQKLQDQIEVGEDGGAAVEEMTKAKEVIASAKKVVAEAT